jgi:ATP-dependent protease ClpP protease subunit
MAAPKVLLTTANTVSIRSQIDDESVTKAQIELARAIRERGAAPYPIYLVLDSPGGSIVAGEDFIQLAKQYSNVHTVSIFAASMASAIVQALPGIRYITSTGMMMFHRAAGRFQGQFEVGEVESQLAFFKGFVRTMEQRNADRMGLSLDAYKAKVINEYWVYGQDAVTDKVADHVADVTCSPQLIESRVTSSQMSFFGESKLVLSGCPLIRGPIQESEQE